MSAVYLKRRPRLDGTADIYGLRLRITVSQTQEEVMRLLCAQFGGNIAVPARPKPHHKQQWAWALQQATESKRFLEAILPFAVVKAPAIRLGLEFLTTVHSAGKRPTQAEWDIRLSVYRQLQILNQHGMRRHKYHPPALPANGWNPKFRYGCDDLKRQMDYMRSRRKPKDGRGTYQCITCGAMFKAYRDDPSCCSGACRGAQMKGKPKGTKLAVARRLEATA